jgi:integrase
MTRRALSEPMPSKEQKVSVLKSAGLRKVRFHDIRHTYASQLISRGANIKYVSTQMGHSSIDITLDYYAKYMPQGDRSEANLLKKNSAPIHTLYTPYVNK